MMPRMMPTFSKKTGGSFISSLVSSSWLGLRLSAVSRSWPSSGAVWQSSASRRKPAKCARYSAKPRSISSLVVRGRRLTGITSAAPGAADAASVRDEGPSLMEGNYVAVPNFWSARSMRAMTRSLPSTSSDDRGSGPRAGPRWPAAMGGCTRRPFGRSRRRRP